MQLSWRSEPTLVYGYIERELLSFDDFLYKYYLRADQLFIVAIATRSIFINSEYFPIRHSNRTLTSIILSVVARWEGSSVRLGTAHE